MRAIKLISDPSRTTTITSTETNVAPPAVEQKPRLVATPLSSQAKTAQKQLGAALKLVVARTIDQLGAAKRDLSASKLGPSESRLRAVEKQLGALRAGAIDGAQLDALRAQTQELRRTLQQNPKAHKLDGLAAKIDDHVARLNAPRVLEELSTYSPKEQIETLLANTPDRAGIEQRLGRLYAGANAFGGPDVLQDKLRRDLGPLRGELNALMARRGLNEADIERFYSAFAEVRAGFAAGASSLDDMQRTNWIHTRTEILHTLQAADALQLSRKETIAALLGSLTSDSFKDSSTFSLLWHNRAGAELVLPLVMGRSYDLSQAENQEILSMAKRVAHEHQITPALFMSGAMRSHLAGRPSAGEIADLIDAPLTAPQKNGEIVFSSEARETLKQAGFPGWAVPVKGTPQYQATQAAIVGDVLQYASAEGILKIAVDIRDPEERRPFMRDATLAKAIGSSLDFSFTQGMAGVEDPKLQKLAAEHRQKMKDDLETVVMPEVERRLKAAVGPQIPYWNVPVATDQERLSPSDRASVDLVKKTFAAVLSEHGGVNLDPFRSSR